MLEKQDYARDESVEAVFLSILRQKDLDMRDKKAAIVDFIAAGIHTVREPHCINYWRSTRFCNVIKPNKILTLELLYTSMLKLLFRQLRIIL